jgi:hypothetical protein
MTLASLPSHPVPNTRVWRLLPRANWRSGRLLAATVRKGDGSPAVACRTEFTPRLFFAVSCQNQRLQRNAQPKLGLLLRRRKLQRPPNERLWLVHWHAKITAALFDLMVRTRDCSHFACSCCRRSVDWPGSHCAQRTEHRAVFYSQVRMYLAAAVQPCTCQCTLFLCRHIRRTAPPMADLRVGGASCFQAHQHGSFVWVGVYSAPMDARIQEQVNAVRSGSQQRCMDVDDITPLVDDITQMAHISNVRELVAESLAILRQR